MIRVLQKTHVNGNFQLKYINSIAWFGKLPCQSPDLLRFRLSESQALLIPDTITVADDLQEERNIIGVAFRANTLYEGMFHVVDRLLIVGIIVEQHLDSICSSFGQPGYRPCGQQFRLSPFGGCIVARHLICEEQTSALSAVCGCL